MAAPNLLAGTETSQPHLTDGFLAAEGDAWLAMGAFELREPWPQWDLGGKTAIGAGLIQSDHNDAYVVSVSDDGVAWRDVWTAAPVPEPGLRTRTGTFDATGRYVRLRAEGGDQHYSASELKLFTSADDLPSQTWNPLPDVPLAGAWAGLLLATAVALLVVKRVRLAAVPLGLYAAWVVRATWVLPTIEPALIDWIRFIAGGGALIALARTFEFRRLLPAPRALVTGVLAASGALAVLAFLNFGRAQFKDLGKGEPTFLHHYDMRVYFPIARFFPELGFDGVYAASAAVVQEDTGLTPELAALPMTNLRTKERPTVGQSQDAVREVRARFSDERWALFKQDMQYFRKAMTEHGFLHSMQDMGGNATPVWFLGARALFLGAPASDGTLWAGVIADIVLMLLAFAAIGWAYGPRTALMAMVVFGAVDLYMFGSNWFGSTLRHDWMALWAIAIALLKKEKFFLGGGILAWAALIRVFPVISFVTLAAPLVWGLWKQRRAFAWKPYARVALGAVAFGAVLMLLSVFVFGLNAWPLWAEKILAMTGGRGVNTVGLANFVSHPVALKAIVLAFTAAALFALRNDPIDEAAGFGPAMLAFVFSPMNYYLHCLFGGVVLGRDDRRVPWLVLAAMCLGGYWAAGKTPIEVHFDREAIVVLVATGALVAWKLAQSAATARRYSER